MKRLLLRETMKLCSFKDRVMVRQGLRRAKTVCGGLLQTQSYFGSRSMKIDEEVNKEKRKANLMMTYGPGLLGCLAVSQTSFLIADLLGQGLLHLQGVELDPDAKFSSPVSGIPISILLGVLLKNGLRLERTDQGAKFAGKTVLQAGIICVGLKLSAVDLVTTGMIGIPAVLLGVSAGLFFVPWFGDKLNLPKKMSYLIAAGTSICGVTAITALSPAIKATKTDTSFAVANVVAFGTFGMLAYPYLAHHIFHDSQQIGMFLGLAVHDTSQVIGSALTYSAVYSDELVLKVAAVTKLSRNLCLAGVIPYLTYLSNKQEQRTGESHRVGISGLPEANSPRPSILSQVYEYTPGFVYGFVGMSAVRTVGDVLMQDSSTWNQVISFVGSDLGSKYLLGTAMAGVGLTTSISSLRGVGIKPFAVGLAGATVVGMTGLMSALVVGEIIN